MRNIFLFTITFFLQMLAFGQPTQLWKSYLSYYNVKDVSSATESVYAGSENALITKNTSTEVLHAINSIDGFKAESITAIHYSATYNKIIAGNANGLIIVVNLNDGTVLNVIDIVAKTTISPAKKKINDIYEHDGKLYISCDFGLCVYNLSINEFGDTYFIGPAGEEVSVYQTTILNNEIFAVTSLYGIRKALLSNPNLIDYSQWSLFDAGNWIGIESFQNQLILANSNTIVYRYQGMGMNPLVSVGQTIVDLETYDNRLLITAPNHVYVYDENFSELTHITQIPDIQATFTCATAINNRIFIGTTDKGLFETTLSNITIFNNITPNGPFRNNIFNIKKAPNFLWAVYGDYTKQYNPYPLDEFGISKYSEQNGWTTIPYSNLSGAKSLSRIGISPTQNNVYVSSYFSGLLKIDAQENVTLFNQTNTGPNGLESLDIGDPTYVDIRVNGPTFDKNGNLWMTNSRIKRALKVLKSDGNWQSYTLENITTNPQNDDYTSMVIDKNNTKWIPSYRNGVIAFNENYGNKFIIIKQGENAGNLPNNDVRCLALDNNNQLWIGTFDGLRVLSNVNRFLTEDTLESNAIIIVEDGLAQELFFQQQVWDIAVDGANQKWVAIADAGVFLVSPNGQETIYHFTMENSPLPSNNINDIEIDSSTGEVFFATDKGLVSFKGTATKPADDLSNVFIYPNPVRPDYNGTVKVSGLIDKANIKITDLEGNLVYETTSEGGTIEWDTKAFGKHKVASGVYMIFIAAADGAETKVKKLMIVR